VAISYAARKLGQVVASAMRSPQALHLRLATCICEISVLTHHDHLPPDLRGRLNEITSACTSVADPTGELGTAVVTAQRMDCLEIGVWLDKIHSLYADVLQREQREFIAREITASVSSPTIL
jgi:hypothetical protein